MNIHDLPHANVIELVCRSLIGHYISIIVNVISFLSCDISSYRTAR